jgi:hypothetical protein
MRMRPDPGGGVSSVAADWRNWSRPIGPGGGKAGGGKEKAARVGAALALWSVLTGLDDALQARRVAGDAVQRDAEAVDLLVDLGDGTIGNGLDRAAALLLLRLHA